MDPTLVSCNDPILSQKLENFDFDNPLVDPIEFAHTLVQSMIREGGLGIAANQLGLPYRVFAILSAPCIVCYNPKIVDVSSETVMLDEGCLSFPKLSVRITRPKFIKVRYNEPNGEVVTKKFDGMTSRVFQHEFDHLEGITMLDRASPIQREKAAKQMKKLNRTKGKIVG